MKKPACIESEKTHVERFRVFSDVNSGLKNIKRRRKGQNLNGSPSSYFIITFSWRKKRVGQMTAVMDCVLFIFLLPEMSVCFYQYFHSDYIHQ